MASEDDEKNVATPLDAERAKLKAAGYTDAEISQILIAKATSGSPQSSTAAGHGVMSNALSSIVAVAGHARILLPSFRQDFANIFDGNAKAAARAWSAIALTFKAAVILILAYAGWQEWKQHIISATAIAESEVRKRHAEECSARIKAHVENTPLNRLLTDEDEELSRDCDPTYATRMKECEENLNTIMAEAEHFDELGDDGQKKAIEKLKSHQANCKVTDAQRKAFAIKVVATQDRINKKQAELKRTQGEFLEIVKIELRSLSEHRARHYDAAYNSALKYLGEIKDYDTKINGKPGALTGEAQVNLAWHGLFVRKLAEAYVMSGDAAKLSFKGAESDAVHAHIVLLMGFPAEAKELYLRHKGEHIRDKPWEQAIYDDFDDLNKGGIIVPESKEFGSLFVASKPSSQSNYSAPGIYRHAQIVRDHEDHLAKYAFQLSQDDCAFTEGEERQQYGKVGTNSAKAFLNMSWYAIFAANYPSALYAANRSLELQADTMGALVNKAHALLFLGRKGEAKEIYTANMNRVNDEKKTWKTMVREDFAELRKFGVTIPNVVEIEDALK